MRRLPPLLATALVLVTPGVAWAHLTHHHHHHRHHRRRTQHGAIHRLSTAVAASPPLSPSPAPPPLSAPESGAGVPPGLAKKPGGLPPGQAKKGDVFGDAGGGYDTIGHYATAALQGSEMRTIWRSRLAIPG